MRGDDFKTCTCRATDRTVTTLGGWPTPPHPSAVHCYGRAFMQERADKYEQLAQSLRTERNDRLHRAAAPLKPDTTVGAPAFGGHGGKGGSGSTRRKDVRSMQTDAARPARADSDGSGALGRAQLDPLGLSARATPKLPPPPPPQRMTHRPYADDGAPQPLGAGASKASRGADARRPAAPVVAMAGVNAARSAEYHELSDSTFQPSPRTSTQVRAIGTAHGAGLGQGSAAEYHDLSDSTTASFCIQPQ